ncbi:MAG: carboxypeptidase-like regulatory domain-containing protein [Bacteroidota bacterium]
MYFRVNYFLLCSTLVLGSFFPLLAQQKYTISGYVQDASSGEKLINAKVYDTRSLQGAITNNFGFFSLTLDEGPLKLVASYPGYKKFELELELTQDSEFLFELDIFQLDEISIVAEEIEQIQDKTEMSTIDVPIKQIKLLPALLGEVDVIKAIQLLPGVQSGNEGTTGMYVRGGGPDQNLILLDDVPLYYVNHLGGFFSVFNADALSNVKLIKGGFPARYGGRLSSVLDIRMKEGNNQEFKAEGSIGLVSSKLSIQGPIIKNKTSFIVSGRRTYLDLFTRPLSSILVSAASEGSTTASVGYFFYDLNAKINHIFSAKDRLYLSLYMGDDNVSARIGDEIGTPGTPDYNRFDLNSRNAWGNQLAALRWNHIWSPKLFSNLTATYTNYRLTLRNGISTEFIDTNNDPFKVEAALKYQSGIRDGGLRLDFDYYPNPNHNIKFGALSTLHRFKPGTAGFNLTLQDTISLDTAFSDFTQNTYETALYVEDQFKVGKRFSANAGLYATHYLVNGEHEFSLQPRISTRFLLSDKVAFKASYALMRQYLHLLINSNTGLPVDLWVPATDGVPAQRAWQVAGGLATSILDGQIELSLEGYYKKTTGLIAYKQGTDLYLGVDEGSWEERVETGGEGWAYGAEFLVQKTQGATTGWIGYTLSWNNRQFENLNQGEVFPYRYDRRHDISVVVAHRFSEKVSVSGTWVFGTGNAISLASGGYAYTTDWIRNSQNLRSYSFGSANAFNSGVQLFENGRNGYRMEPYHRLDLGINFTKKKKWGSRTWNFGVYNAYNRLNPYFYYIGIGTDTFTTGEAKPALRKVSLFPIIPSISYSFIID